MEAEFTLGNSTLEHSSKESHDCDLYIKYTINNEEMTVKLQSVSGMPNIKITDMAIKIE